MYQSSDEISLRELYLIFRSGLVAIIITTVLVGAAAYLYLSTRPESYEASAIVQVSVPQVPEGNAERAWVLQPVHIGADTYESIANSTDVLAAAFDVSEDDVEELHEISERLELNVITNGNRSQDNRPLGQFTAAHIVHDPDPRAAAQLANAWAKATASAATAIISNNLSASIDVATRELDQRRLELDEARTAWAAFAENDERSELSSQLTVLRQLQSEARLRVSKLTTMISSSRAQYNLIAATTTVENGADSPELEVQLNAMMDSGVLDQDGAGVPKQTLSIVPSGLSLEGQELLRVITQARLESLASAIAGHVAELDQHRAELGATDNEILRLRTQIAGLEKEAAQLQQDLSEAQSAYNGVSGIAPLIRLHHDLLAHAAAVLVPATRPLAASGSQRLTITLAAALVAGLLATLAVFLRAAVREPNTPVGGGVNRQVSQINPASGDVQPTRTGADSAGSSGDHR